VTVSMVAASSTLTASVSALLFGTRALLQLSRLRRDAHRWGFGRSDQVSDAVVDVTR
jgi:hypothetical protein